MKYSKITREEELKNRVAGDLFALPNLRVRFDLRDLDFVVGTDFEPGLCDEAGRELGEFNFLWAEAKRGKADLVAALAQLVLISHELALAPFCFSFAEDKKELKDFIKVHFDTQRLTKSKIQIDKNNFLGIYKRWLRLVKDSIAVDWDEYRRVGILDIGRKSKTAGTCSCRVISERSRAAFSPRKFGWKSPRSPPPRQSTPSSAAAAA